MSNPDWSRDELILALDLYFRVPSARGSKTNPEVQELSKILNLLPIHRGQDLDEDFRNPNGVGMKLSNFLRFDPSYEGKGLKRGSRLEEEIWATFSGDLQRLNSVSTAIREAVATRDACLESSINEAEQEAPEGSVLTRLHMFRERSKSLAAAKKKEAMRLTGILECEVCGFDFTRTYGKHGSGFAECHHIKPISTLMPGQRTRASDLAIVCANCHRMLHRGKSWPSVTELRHIVKSQTGNAS
jgi:5-methylcytosine-specific restriction enzyme A